MTQITIPSQTLIDGGDNIGGVDFHFAWAFLDEIAVDPDVVLKDDGTVGNLEDLVTITGNIEMDPTNTPSFRLVEITQDSGELKEALPGETDGKVTTSEYNCFIPGSKKTILGLTEIWKNRQLILLIPDHEGNVRKFGSKAFPARLSNREATTGKKTEDLHGNTFTFTLSKGPAPFFEGVIQLDDTPTYQADIPFIPSSPQV